MYKEALIRNTYQGILANRPRDLTEEELEALAEAEAEAEAAKRPKSADDGCSEDRRGGNGDNEEADTSTPVCPTQRIAAMPSAVATPPQRRAVGQYSSLGLPPLAGGGGGSQRTTDSPMSRAAPAPVPAAPNTPPLWRPSATRLGLGNGKAHSVATVADTATCRLTPTAAASCEEGESAPSLSLGGSTTTYWVGYGGTGADSPAAVPSVPATLTNSPLNLGKVRGGAAVAALEGAARRAEAEAEAEAAEGAEPPMISWAEDNEDEFYDTVLAGHTLQQQRQRGGDPHRTLVVLEKRRPQSRDGVQHMHANDGAGSRRGGGGDGGGRRGSGHRNRPVGAGDVVATDVDADHAEEEVEDEEEEVFQLAQRGGHKGGRNSRDRRRRDGGRGRGGRGVDQSGRGGGSGSGGANVNGKGRTSNAKGGGGGGGGGAPATPSGGRFDSLRR